MSYYRALIKFEQPVNENAGLMSIWPTNTPPVGALICDGSLVSRVMYADLFDKIGVTFGSGDGSTTFALPDLRGRFVRVLDTSGGSFDLGVNGRTNRGDGVTGANVGTLQGSSIEAHTHTVVSANNVGFTARKALQGTVIRNNETSFTGVSETTPLNKYVNYIIGY